VTDIIPEVGARLAMLIRVLDQAEALLIQRQRFGELAQIALQPTPAHQWFALLDRMPERFIEFERLPKVILRGLVPAHTCRHDPLVVQRLSEIRFVATLTLHDEGMLSGLVGALEAPQAVGK